MGGSSSSSHVTPPSAAAGFAHCHLLGEGHLDCLPKIVINRPLHYQNPSPSSSFPHISAPSQVKGLTNRFHLLTELKHNLFGAKVSFLTIKERLQRALGENLLAEWIRMTEKDSAEAKLVSYQSASFGWK